jgi:hypothetical protein
MEHTKVISGFGVQEVYGFLFLKKIGIDTQLFE